MTPAIIGPVVALAILVFILVNAIRILPEYERGVVFRLGRLRPYDYGPGLFLLLQCGFQLSAIDDPVFDEQFAEPGYGDLGTDAFAAAVIERLR